VTTVIDRAAIERAHGVIMPYIRVTPVAPDLDTLLVSVGGGGLIGGIAAWCGGRPRERVGVVVSGGNTTAVDFDP
jgi:hypothetical protein